MRRLNLPARSLALMLQAARTGSKAADCSALIAEAKITMGI
jgi:hypothetical protein